jgi:POT family proton-dependent oligopeptide transporter
VGDQFGEDKAHLVTKVFQIFYFSINFGSFFSQIITPALYVGVGPEVAFGVPGILMVVAAVVFWAGRNRFVRVPAQPGGVLGLLDAVVTICLLSPFFALIVGYFVLWEHFVPPPGAAGLAAFGAFLGSYPWLPLGTLAALGAGVALFVVRQRIQPDTTSFLPVLVWSVRNRRLRRPGQSLFDPARERFGEEAGDGPPAVLRIMLVFSAVSVFWALFDQHASTWVEQAKQMDLTLSIPGRSEPVRMNPAQVAALNPIMVMILIPALNLLVYAPLRRRGVEVKPLVRMAAGMFIAALAFVAAAALQGVIERVGTGQIHAVWQVGQYLFLTVAEVLVSITGLEFAYTQAPRAMKSTIMGFWLACIAMGNILVAFLAPLQKRLPLSQFFWLFAGLMLVAAVLFSILARFYRGKTYLQRA